MYTVPPVDSGGTVTDLTGTDSLRLRVSLFEDERSTRPAGQEIAWDELRARLLRFDLRETKSGPAWSPVRYAEGASRGNAGVEAVYLAVMDVDDGTDPELVHRRLTELGFEHVIHSTYSSTPEHPKFRAIVPLANPCSASSWPAIFPRLCALLTEGHTDPGTKDPARLYYLPSARPGGKTFTYSGGSRPVLAADLPPPTETASPPVAGVELGADGKLPHGRHYEWLRSFTASVVSRTPGIAETQAAEATRAAFGAVADDLAEHEAEIPVLVRSALGKYGRPAPVDDPGADGPSLFREVRASLEQHYKFEQPWHSVLCALFVIQAHVARSLPATFYLIVKGRYGGGKTSLLNVIGKLGGGLVFENVSVAALARELAEGRLVCIDEYDVRRPAEIQPVLDSIVRQGYRRDAAPYTRYDATKKEVERIPVYGPKALTIRSFLDPALESRGFIISASPVDGEEAYGFVVRNLWSDVGDLPARLARWAAGAAVAWPDARLKALAESPTLADTRRRVLEATGANRDTEQVLVALLVAEIAGVDVAAELKEAVELRRASVGTEDAGDLEDLTDAILAASGSAQDRLIAGSPRVRILFRELKAEIDRRRKERDERPISNNRLATILTQAGVSESWKVRPGNKVGFDLPVEFVRGLREGGPNSPNRPNPVVLDENVRTVRTVRTTPLTGVSARQTGTDDRPAEPGSWQEGPVRARKEPDP